MIETTADDIIERIQEIDGQLVMLDEDLADFLGVAPPEIRAMVRRNKDAFPVEFVIDSRGSGVRETARRECLAPGYRSPD